MRRSLLLIPALLLVLSFAGCGGGDADEAGSTTAVETTRAVSGVELGGVKSYLTDHTEKLAGATAEFDELAKEYDALAKRRAA